MAYDHTIQVLRDGKTAIRQIRQRSEIEEKLLDLVRLQHIYVQIVGSRRPLRLRERPWMMEGDTPMRPMD